MKYISFILPSIVVLLTIFGIVGNYYAGNTAAMNANITAAIGWLIVAGDKFVDFLNERNQRA